MGKTLSELTNDVKFKADWRTLEKVKKRMRDLEKEGDKLRKSLLKPLKLRMDSGGLGKTKTQMHGIGTEASKLRSTLSKPMRLNIDSSKLASIRSQMRGAAHDAGLMKKALAFGGGFLAGGAIASVGRSFFETNVSMAKLEGALKTITGSTEAANAKFKELQKFGASTPFTFEQSARAFIKLKNLGLDPSERSLRSYGNTATAMGKSMMDMIEAVADASTGEFERLKEFGIKSKSQGDQVEFTFQNVKTKVKKNAKEIEKYLRGIGETKFAKAMADQMNSLPGMVSNAQDSIETFYYAVGKAGVNNALIEILRDFSMALSGIDAEPIGKRIGAAISGAYKWIKQAVSGVKELINNLGGIASVARAAGVMIGFMMAPLIGGQIIAAYKGLKSLYGLLKSLTMLQAGQGLFALLGGWPLLIGAAVIAVGLLAYDIYRFATGGKSWIGSLSKQFPIFGQVVKSIGDFFKGMMPTINQWGKMLTDMAPSVTSIFESIGMAVGAIMIALAPALMGIFDALGSILGAIFTVIGAFITFTIQAIAALAPLIAEVFRVASWIISLFMMTFGVVIGAFIGFIAAVIGGFIRLVAAVVSFMAAILSAIIGLVMAGITWFIQLFTRPADAARNFQTTVTGIINNIRGAFMNLVNSVVNAFAGGFGRISGIIGGLIGQVNNVLNRINSAKSGVGKTSALLPGGGGRGGMSANFNNGGNTFNIYDSDPTKISAAFGNALSGTSESQLSDFARTVPVMIGSFG